MKRFPKGFTYLELVVVIAIISILVVVASDRLLRLRVDAERVAMMRVVDAVRNSAGTALAEYVLERRLHDLPELVGTNPMDLVLEPPPNYQGEYRGDDPPVPAGSWYFDVRRGELVYRVQYSEYFQAQGDRADEARFRLVLAYDDVNEDELFTEGADKIRGLQIRPVRPYSWQVEPDTGRLSGNGGFGPGARTL